MSTLLLLAATLAAPITETDWVATDGQHFLALRPGESDQSGHAYYIQQKKDSWEAFDGIYSLHDENGRNKLRVSFIHEWTRPCAAEHSRWFYAAYYDRERYGVELEYEVERGRAVVTFENAFAIDEQGKPDRSAKVRPYQHIQQRQIIQFAAGDLPASMQRSVPPTFVARARWRANHLQHSQSVFGIEGLTRADWFGWVGTEDSPYQSYEVLSLDAGDQWSKGDAWCVSFSTSQHGTFASAGRGTYTIGISDSGDAILRLSFPRGYSGWMSENKIGWEVQRSDRQYGLNLAIPLADRAVRAEPLLMRADDLFYVDASGAATRRYQDAGPFGLLKSERKPRSVSAPNINQGGTLAMRIGSEFGGAALGQERAYLQLLATSPPPFFELRAPRRVAAATTTSRVTTNRPTTNTTNAMAPPTTPPRESGESLGQKALQALNDGAPRNGYHLATAALQVQPDYAGHWYTRACCLEELGFAASVVRDLNKTLELGGGSAEVHNFLAWILATDPRSEVRDGKRAVELARKACDAARWQSAMYLDTLAAADAESGNFQHAVRHQERVLTLEDVDGWREEAESRLSLYRRGSAYREPIRRQWLDSTHSKTTFAEVVSVGQDSIRLRKTTGDVIQVALSRLSEDDRTFVKSIRHAVRQH